MKIGILQTEKNEKAKELLKSNKASIGVDAEQLYNQLNLMEIQTGYNSVQILAELKKELMVITGRLIIQPQTEEAEEEGEEEGEEKAETIINKKAGVEDESK